MATLPYVTAPGNVLKALNGIISASTPERVSQDFVKEMLKIPGGSGNQIASYLKKVGLANQDSTPSENYKKFRNESTRGQAAAAILRIGYAPLFKRNEFMYELSESKLKGLIIEETGASEDSAAVSNTVACIKHLKSFAVFHTEDEPVLETVAPITTISEYNSSGSGVKKQAHDVGLNLSYTINLNLPATSDIAVFNAIFKSLKENLLRDPNE